MADIELVIKMPEEVYKSIKNGKNYISYQEYVEGAIKNGTPLPKGHGRLIDADAFQKTYCKESCGDRPCVDAMDRCIFIGELLLAPTIIEADKGDKE